MSLADLEKKVAHDLEMINFKAKPWRQKKNNIYDVVIIGAGMAGLAATFALMKLGVYNVQLFDARSFGKEGPWLHFARMKTLRSTKVWMGPAVGFPALTFQAWFEAQFGEKEWEKLGKIPTPQWMEYLNWYRHILHLPVKNDTTLVEIVPVKDHFKLIFNQEEVEAFKVVLATGRSGFGGMQIPSFMETIPKEKWAHTDEEIDFKRLKNKRVGVIGAGASGFDAAAVALEHGAKSVDLFTRRPNLPNVNVERELFFPGCYWGFSHLSDQEKWDYYSHSCQKGSLPPKEALQRVRNYSNFHLHLNAKMEEILDQFDFLIVAAGFRIDGSKQPELHHFFSKVKLWKDLGFDHPRLGNFPYLGQHFEFIEKKRGDAPYLKNIHCFNYAATLSHAGVASEIPAISYGAERLAEGITADLFLKDKKYYFDQFKNFNIPDFCLEDFKF